MPSENDPGLAMAQSMMSDDLKRHFAATSAGELKPQGLSLESFLQAEIDNWFTYHTPTQTQLAQYQGVRDAGKMFAETINRFVPAGADKTAAMRKVREAVMTANAAIACHWEA